ncbi:hypothetical protein RHMOL_Rhmol02G0193500 [Rhododendron molle]|uniref:Uncharacterized protein n=1 Tax=Rhododendron molle TaxID=49168 RepID=A0ACC0PV04_RHOML|nr:hypothetical protein RHMOL_Rhmol02G0193500 [Rhododendron molle]
MKRRARVWSQDLDLEPARSGSCLSHTFKHHGDVSEPLKAIPNGFKYSSLSKPPTLSRIPSKTLDLLQKSNKTKHTHAPMADHGNGGGEGEVVDQVEDRGGPMEAQTGDQMVTEGAVGISAVVAGGGDGGEDQQQKVGDGEKGRATEGDPCTTVLAGAVESSGEPAGSSAIAGGPPMVGGSSGGVGGSGATGYDPGLNGTPPRDTARGKGIAVSEKPVEEEQTTEAAPVEIREEDITFRPPVTMATSSRHVPITKDDIAEHLPVDMLARLLEAHPDIGEIVLKAKEE